MATALSSSFVLTFHQAVLNPDDVHKSTFSKSATTLGLAEQAFWRVSFGSLQCHRYILHWDFFLWDFGISMLFSHSAA